MRCFAFALVAALALQIAPIDPLETEVYIYDGGSIYHQRDCVGMTGRVNIHPVKLRELAGGWDPDSYCRPARRPVGAAVGRIAAEYLNLFKPPRASMGISLPAATSSDPGAGIRPKCAADWPDDFTMRAYCEKQQREAVAALLARPMTSVDQATIRTKCRKDWASDYNMQNYCEQQQLKALAIVK